MNCLRRFIPIIRPTSHLIAMPHQSKPFSASPYLHTLEDFFEEGKSLPIHDPDKVPAYGRAWKSDELRIKSFEDIHRLWFVLLKERNLLATQKAEAQRLGQQWFGNSRIHKTKLSMARIKTILLERHRLHFQTSYLVAIKEGQREHSAGNLLVELNQTNCRRLLKGKRDFRRRMRYHKRVPAKF